MLKRIGQIDGVKLYDIVKSRENIEEAIRLACKDHAKDPAVIKIKENPEPYIQAIQQILDDKSYHPSKYFFRVIYERGKKRKLCYTRTFPDRMIQHCVFNVVAPILHSTIPTCSYAGVKGRGIHLCRTHIEEDLKEDRKGMKYCLKLDVYHYFPSVNRDLLFEMVKSKIKDCDVLKLIATIIYECPNKNGLPIGLYSSQILSTFFLSDLDRYCKQILKIAHYYRYMDDIVLFSNSKEILWKELELIRDFLHDKKLRIKGNYAVFPIVKRRLDFIGYVFGLHNVMVRKRTKISYIRSCNAIIRALSHHVKITMHMLRS